MRQSCVTILRDGAKYSLNELLYFAIGLLPILAIVLYFKIWVAPSNDIFLGLNTRLYAIMDISRYMVIARAFIDQFMYFGSQMVNLPIIRYISLPFLLIVYYCMLGGMIDKRYKRATITAALVLTIMWMGYFYIYAITSMPLKWHLATSLTRLAVQLWVPFLFLFFMIIRTPEGALNAVLSNKTQVENGCLV
jgi:hypothetical protein